MELSAANVSWYEGAYGGSLSWVLDLLLAEFRSAHHIDPAQLAAIGAKALKRKIDSEIV